MHDLLFGPAVVGGAGFVLAVGRLPVVIARVWAGGVGGDAGELVDDLAAARGVDRAAGGLPCARRRSSPACGSPWASNDLNKGS